MVDAWYATAEWDELARLDFETRLARTRLWNRQQYLHSKGVRIVGAGHVDDGISLIERSIALPGGVEFLRNGARESLADILRANGREAEAADVYRYVIANPAQGWGTSNSIDIKLLEILLDAWDSKHEAEVARLIDARIKPSNSLRLNSDEFRFCLCMIRLADIHNDREAERTWARVALDLAAADPVLPRKPFFAVVRSDAETLAWLRERAA